MRRFAIIGCFLWLSAAPAALGAPAPGMALTPGMAPGMTSGPAILPAPGMTPAPTPSPTFPPGMAPAPGMTPAPTPSPASPPATPASPPATPASQATLKPGWTPHAGASIDLGGRKRVFVGDPFRVTVTVIAREQVSVNLPTSLDLGDFSLLKAQPDDREPLDGHKTKHVFRLTVAAYKVGTLTLPPIPVTYVPPREAFASGADDPTRPAPALVVTTQKVEQQVASVLANEPHPQLKKNAPPMTILVEDRRMRIVLIVVIALLVGAALGFLIFWLLRNRRRLGPPPPPPRPAHETALAKLRLIREAGYLERGEFKPFYFGVSEAIRDYLGNRYGFDSLEMTTTELADQMRGVEMTGIGYDELVHFLMDCDLVKFAKYIPPLEDAERILAQAEHIVHSTKYIPAPDPDEDDEDDEGEGPRPATTARPASPPPAAEAKAPHPDERWAGGAPVTPTEDAPVTPTEDAPVTPTEEEPRG